MTLLDAWNTFCASPRDPNAMGVLMSRAKELSTRRGVVPEFREQALDHAKSKLFQRAIDNDLPLLDHERRVEAYLQRTLSRASISAWRKRMAELRALERYAQQEKRRRQREAEQEARLLDRPAWDLLDHAQAKARGRLRGRRQAAFDRSWRQMRALHAEDITLAEIAVRDEGANAEREADVDTACARLTKRHERVREDLMDEVPCLLRLGPKAGGIAPEEAVRLTDAIERLRRRIPREKVAHAEDDQRRPRRR